MTRVQTMYEGLLASENKRARMLITVSVFNADERRLHQTFRLKAWTNRDGVKMITADLDDGDWAAGTWATKVAHLNVATGTVYPARETKDALLIYAAKAAIQYAQTGTVPTPGNGRVEAVEASLCGRCGAKLTDPVSIERGIGPECFGRETGTTTIRSRSKATKAEKALHAEQQRITNGDRPSIEEKPSSQLTELPGETWEDIFKGARK